MAVFTAIAAAITSAFFAVAGAMGATLATAGLALAGTIVGYVGAAVIYGGVALALSSVAGKIGKRGGSYGDSSATYGNPVLQTQTNQELPIPLLYGTVKLGGNRIWQDDDVNKNIKRIVGFAEGEITDFTDIRLNDIKQADIKGISVNKYLGTSSQQVDSIVGGKNNAERVEKVGSLKNVAYLAINVPKGEKIDANYNLTTVVKGRKIRVYTTPTKYTVKYSENPAWVMFDFLTSYNGLGLCLNNDGTINNGLMGLKGYQVKVTSVVDDGAGTFTVNWRNYDERLYNDTLGSKEPRVLVSTLSDIYAYPEDVKNFNVVQQDNYFNFTWSYNQDPSDLYEIRMGDSWESGKVIGSNLKANTFDYKILTPGTYRFWIKAYTNYQYSKNPTLDVININAIPNLNEIIKYDLIETAQGEYLNTYKYHNTIKLTPLASENKIYDILENMAGTYDGLKFYNGLLKFAPEFTLWNNTEDAWGDENAYYESNGKWGATPYTTGTYTSQIYDIEALTSNSITFNSHYISEDEVASVKFEWRRSDNGNTWTEWENITAGGYRYRYFQIKITVNSSSQVLIDKCQLGIEFKILWNTTTPETWNTGDNQYYQNGGIWGALTKATGTYTSQIYDIGLMYECLVSFDSQYISIDDQADVNIYWQYSKDGINWSSYLQ